MFRNTSPEHVALFDKLRFRITGKKDGTAAHAMNDRTQFLFEDLDQITKAAYSTLVRQGVLLTLPALGYLAFAPTES